MKISQKSRQSLTNGKTYLLALEPTYSTRVPNETIVLHQGVLELKQGNDAATANGKIELNLLHGTEINFAVEDAVLNTADGQKCVDLDEISLSW